MRRQTDAGATTMSDDRTDAAWHQKELEEREWRELMDSEHYKAWSKTLRDASEKEQSETNPEERR